MNGVYGFVDCAFPEPQEVVRAMLGPGHARVVAAANTGVTHALAAAGWPHTATLFARDDGVVALHGHPYWEEQGGRQTTVSAIAPRVLDAYAERGEAALQSLHGDFAIALIDPRAQSRIARGGPHERAQPGLRGAARWLRLCAIVGCTRAHSRCRPSSRSAAGFQLPVLPHGARPRHDLQRVASRAAGTRRRILEWSRRSPSSLAPGVQGRHGSRLPEPQARLPRGARGRRARCRRRTGLRRFPVGRHRQLDDRGSLGRVTGAPAKTFSIGFDAARLRRDGVRAHRRPPLRDGAPRVLRDAGRRASTRCRGSPPPTTSRSATRRRCRPTTAHARARTRRRRACSAATAATSSSAATPATPGNTQFALYERVPEPLAPG